MKGKRETRFHEERGCAKFGVLIELSAAVFVKLMMTSRLLVDDINCQRFQNVASVVVPGFLFCPFFLLFLLHFSLFSQLTGPSKKSCYTRVLPDVFLLPWQQQHPHPHISSPRVCSQRVHAKSMNFIIFLWYYIIIMYYLFFLFVFTHFFLTVLNSL